MNYINKLFVLILFIMTVICNAHAESKNNCSMKDSKAIHAAIYHYLDTHSAVSSHDVKVSYLRCAGLYSSAKVIPLKPITDTAMVYLHKIHHHWDVMSLGTAFDNEFLSNIPKKIRFTAE